MAVDREYMIHAGWRQGAMVLPHPNLGGHETALGFLVLNQTCDCVNPDFEKEPYLELLPLKKLTGKSNSNFIHGKNPRQIHFQILERKVEIWVNAKISEIFHHHRSEHASLEISKSTLSRNLYWMISSTGGHNVICEPRFQTLLKRHGVLSPKNSEKSFPDTRTPLIPYCCICLHLKR